MPINADLLSFRAGITVELTIKKNDRKMTHSSSLQATPIFKSFDSFRAEC